MATAARLNQTRAELSRLAADVAHHNAAHQTRGDGASSRYLDTLRRHRAIGRVVRSASVRVVRVGAGEFVEVRVRALVGIAVVGHPKIWITVVKSEPVE